MGLDMFLDGRRYLSPYSTRDKPISKNVIKNFPELAVIGIDRIKKRYNRNRLLEKSKCNP